MLTDIERIAPCMPGAPLTGCDGTTCSGLVKAKLGAVSFTGRFDAHGFAAAIGLKDTRTGDTMCDDDNPIILEAMKFPNPVIDVAIEPKSKADQDKLATALQKLQEEDPTFRVRTDAETSQTIIAGMGELHLEILVDRMRREFKVEANVGKPQVAFRETVKKRVENVEGKFVRQSGGKGQYGHVVIHFEPTKPGDGFIFEDKIVGGVIPREFIKPVEAGIKEALESGVLAAGLAP